jgi:Omp85 superfamily domain
MRLTLPCLAAALALAPAARADDGAGPPSFMRDKPRIPDADTKKEGVFGTGIPAFTIDPDTGVGLGAVGYLTLDGPRSSPLFAYTPYQQQLYLQLYATTKGYQQHEIHYDAPYVRGSPFRVRLDLMFERNTSANYFGVGEATLDPLGFQGKRYATYAEQLAAAGALAPGGKTASPRYDHYLYVKPSGYASVERDFWGGKIRVLYGAVVQHWSIDRYDGDPTQGTDAQGHAMAATEGPTKLGIDCQRAAVAGCGGGWNDLLKAGVAFDTRDFEKNPRSGVFADATGEWSSRAFGSSFSYLRLTIAGRFYLSPFRRAASGAGAGLTPSDVVLAGRLLYSMQGGNVPFFAMDTLAFTEGDQQGLGGERTLRGYPQDRFVGRAAALANAELRWNFAHFPLLQQQFALQLAPFFDTGRVFDQVSLALTKWRPAGGGGLRIAWNQSTVVMFDLAGSPEDTAFYIDVDLMY